MKDKINKRLEIIESKLKRNRVTITKTTGVPTMENPPPPPPKNRKMNNNKPTL